MANEDVESRLGKAVRARDDAHAAIERAQALVESARAEAQRRKHELVDAAVDAYRNGMRQKDIATRTRLTRETIRRYLRAAGITAED